MDKSDRNSSEQEDQTASDSHPGDIVEMDITGPTLTWLELDQPKQTIPIGENDRVLDSRYNEEYDAWEILLVALPDDDESD